MNMSTTTILILSLIGFIYLLFKLRLSFKEEAPKWIKLFIKRYKG